VAAVLVVMKFSAHKGARQEMRPTQQTSKEISTRNLGGLSVNKIVKGTRPPMRATQYRGTSLIRNCPPPRTTIGPWA
jgi:hypothetical protein